MTAWRAAARDTATNILSGIIIAGLFAALWVALP